MKGLNQVYAKQKYSYLGMPTANLITNMTLRTATVTIKLFRILLQTDTIALEIAKTMFFLFLLKDFDGKIILLTRLQKP